MKSSKHLQQFVEQVIMEQQERPLYTAIVVDSLGAMKMRREMQKQDLAVDRWLTSNIHPAHGNQQLSHHMTITPGSLKPTDSLRMRLNQDVTVRVVGWGFDRSLGVAAWQVEPITGFPVKSGVPHITAQMENETVKPFKAAKIKNWRKLAEPFTVHGTFTEVFPKRG
mgnify:FL=1